MVRKNNEKLSLFDDLFSSSHFDNVFFNSGLNQYDTYFIDDSTSVLEINAAGFDKKDINIELVNGKLTIKGKRDIKDIKYEHSYINKSINLVFGLNDSKHEIDASLENGILKIIIKEIKKNQTKIDIK